MTKVAEVVTVAGIEATGNDRWIIRREKFTINARPKGAGYWVWKDRSEDCKAVGQGDGDGGVWAEDYAPEMNKMLRAAEKI